MYNVLIYCTSYFQRNTQANKHKTDYMYMTSWNDASWLCHGCKKKNLSGASKSSFGPSEYPVRNTRHGPSMSADKFTTLVHNFVWGGQ